MPVISLMNQKGGVAKTTTTINLAAQASLKHKTLIVDADKQNNLSYNFGVTNPSSTITHAFLDGNFVPINIRKNLDLLPSDESFIGIDLKISAEIGRLNFLKKALKKVKEDYDYIFIDCPPDISLVTMNAMVASDYVILPVKADEFSIQGVERMLEFIRKIREENANPYLQILGILITQYDDRLTISKSIIEKIEDNNWGAALFNTKIRKNTAIENSQYKKQTIFEYDRKSNAAMDYMLLGEEVLSKIKKLNK